MSCEALYYYRVDVYGPLVAGMRSQIIRGLVCKMEMSGATWLIWTLAGQHLESYWSPMDCDLPTKLQRISLNLPDLYTDHGGEEI